MAAKSKKPTFDELSKAALDAVPGAIGRNAAGEMVYEDKRGVRSILRDGVRSWEKVALRPTRDGVKASVEHSGEFVTKAEEDAKAAPASAPAAPAPSANTIFTEDAAEKARAILKAKLGRLNSGIDPEILQAGITLAGYHIEKGARSFGAYAGAMVSDLGDAIKPYLKSFYMAIKYDPRATEFAKELSPAPEGWSRYGNTVVGPPGDDWTHLRIVVERLSGAAQREAGERKLIEMLQKGLQITDVLALKVVEVIELKNRG